jgi:hypothetical protein
MTKHVLRALAVVTTATLAAGLAASPAGAADPAPTTTTFTITGGGLAITAPGTARLGSVPTGSASVSEKLGDVTVTDTRGALAATWTATVQTTDFTTGQKTAAETVPKANVLYLPGLPTAANPVGVFAPTIVDAEALGALPLPVYSVLTAGNNSVTWNPTVTVMLPAQAVAGEYTGTITHSVS